MQALPERFKYEKIRLFIKRADLEKKTEVIMRHNIQLKKLMIDGDEQQMNLCDMGNICCKSLIITQSEISDTTFNSPEFQSLSFWKCTLRNFNDIELPNL